MSRGDSATDWVAVWESTGFSMPSSAITTSGLWSRVTVYLGGPLPALSFLDTLYTLATSPSKVSLKGDHQAYFALLLGSPYCLGIGVPLTTPLPGDVRSYPGSLLPCHLWSYCFCSEKPPKITTTALQCRLLCTGTSFFGVL